MPKGLCSRPGWSGRTSQRSLQERGVRRGCRSAGRRAGRRVRAYRWPGRTPARPAAGPACPGASTGVPSPMTGRVGGRTVSPACRVRPPVARPPSGRGMEGATASSLPYQCGSLLAAECEHLGRPGRPVAALFAVLPPHHEQLAVGVAELRSLPAVQVGRAGAGRGRGAPRPVRRRPPCACGLRISAGQASVRRSERRCRACLLWRVSVSRSRSASSRAGQPSSSRMPARRVRPSSGAISCAATRATACGADPGGDRTEGAQPVERRAGAGQARRAR